MITIHVTPDDLVNTRFAYRPLLEIPLSYRVLINPEYQSPHRRWVEEANRALYDIELPYLSAVIPLLDYIPDFLTPTPMTNRISIEDDLEEVLATPEATIRKNIQTLIHQEGDSELRQFYLAHPHEAVQCLVEELRVYWQRALAHSWSRMIGILEGDILYRGRVLALDGPDNLLLDLDPTITYQKSQIQLMPLRGHEYRWKDFHLAGDGIQLVPTIFAGCGHMVQITPEWHPMILYGARGVGPSNQETRAAKSLEVALGAGRARVLQGLRTPATTGELAHRLGLTSGAISQQLQRLMLAGLVEPQRSGRRVYYRLTQRGEMLIALFERIN